MKNNTALVMEGISSLKSEGVISNKTAKLLTRHTRISDIMSAWKKKLMHANYREKFLKRSAVRRTNFANAE